MKRPTFQSLGLVLAALLTITFVSAFAGEAVPVTRFTLDNGLEVWYLQRMESQSVAVCLTVRAGSRYEDPTQKGLSHFLEHAVFEATDRFNDGRGRMIEIISAKGGLWNGETSEEHTNFWALIPSEHFDTAAEWISQLVFHPTLPANKMEQVRSVIFEEKGGKSSWLGRKLDQFGLGNDLDADIRKRLFPGSALSCPVIGEDKTLTSIKRDALAAYHTTRYTPNNSVLIVVGNVEREQVDRACKTHFAEVPKGAVLPLPDAPKLSEVAIPRIVRHAPPGGQGGVVFSVRTVGAKDPDKPALKVLGELLDQSLLKELDFDQGLAYETGVDDQWFCDSGVLTLMAKAKGSDAMRIEKIMQAQIDRVRKGEVEPEKLEAAKTAVTGHWALSLEGNLGWMDWLESMAFLYTPDEPLPNVTSLVAAVRPEDLTRVVKQYFTPQRTCVAVVRGFL